MFDAKYIKNFCLLFVVIDKLVSLFGKFLFFALLPAEEPVQAVVSVVLFLPDAPVLYIRAISVRPNDIINLHSVIQSISFVFPVCRNNLLYKQDVLAAENAKFMGMT